MQSFSVSVHFCGLKFVHFVSRVAAEMNQFLLDLGELGETIRLYPVACKPLLVQSQTQLSLAMLKRLYAINWSPVGSNRRNEEEETVFFFEMYLADCERKWHGDRASVR